MLRNLCLWGFNLHYPIKINRMTQMWQSNSWNFHICHAVKTKTKYAWVWETIPLFAFVCVPLPLDTKRWIVSNGSKIFLPSWNELGIWLFHFCVTFMQTPRMWQTPSHIQTLLPLCALSPRDSKFWVFQSLSLSWCQLERNRQVLRLNLLTYWLRSLISIGAVTPFVFTILSNFHSRACLGVSLPEAVPETNRWGTHPLSPVE